MSVLDKLVDLSQLAKGLFCNKCNTPLSLRDLESETQHGLAYDMIVNCQSCQTMYKVFTDKPDPATVDKSVTFGVNKKLVIGLIDSGSGVDPFNNVLSALKVPPVSKGLMKRHEKYIAPAFEEAANNSWRKGITEEKRLSTDNNRMN